MHNFLKALVATFLFFCFIGCATTADAIRAIDARDAKIKELEKNGAEKDARLAAIEAQMAALGSEKIKALDPNNKSAETPKPPKEVEPPPVAPPPPPQFFAPQYEIARASVPPLVGINGQLPPDWSNYPDAQFVIRLNRVPGGVTRIILSLNGMEWTIPAGARVVHVLIPNRGDDSGKTVNLTVMRRALGTNVEEPMCKTLVAHVGVIGPMIKEVFIQSACEQSLRGGGENI